jgi:glc operon protein GlcG
MLTRLVLLFAVCTLGFADDLTTKKALTLSGAKRIAAAAEAEAVKNKWNVVIAIVDDGGNLLYLQRADGTQIGSVDVAVAKARTAIKFKRPSKALEDAVAGGRNAVLALPGAVPVEGGVPLMAASEIIGAIGVSGVTSQQDGQIAAAGAAEVAKMQ